MEGLGMKDPIQVHQHSVNLSVKPLQVSTTDPNHVPAAPSFSVKGKISASMQASQLSSHERVIFQTGIKCQLLHLSAGDRPEHRPSSLTNFSCSAELIAEQR